ncbi:uncharacterized protein LOC136075080 [Hydra vulgaris]|uniref:Uncharacterized protein LOC136075080 n=1 Tax=Hydra vulgaris TaxID=6087 RepID=A0ABM4B3J7_HYDVU
MGNGLFSSSVKKEVSRNDLASYELISKCCGEVSYNIGSDWLRWGRHLGLSDSDLDNIGFDNKNCYEKADNVLKKWKQKNESLSWEQLKKELMDFDRLDIVDKIETKFGDTLSSKEKISIIECRIPYGCVFKFDLLEGQFCREVEFQLYSVVNNWIAINNKRQAFRYYLTKKKNTTLFVKVEKLLFQNETINFKFSFQGLNKKSFQHHCSVIITGNCNYDFNYNGLCVATPEPFFNDEFRQNIKSLNSLDWRQTNNICLNKVPHNKSIELIALDYFNRNFPDCNDVIYVTSSIVDNDNLVVSKFIDLFTINCTGIRAVLPGYRLHYHASLLNCDVKKFTYYNDENRIMIFASEFNLVIIARVATSMDCLKLESEQCLNDVILFVNVNNPLIDTNKLIILGIVVLPLHDRKQLKEELFYHFSEDFGLDQILFLCKDDIEDKNFESWWRLVVAYCIKKVNAKNNSEVLFKKLISLTMMSMSIVDYCYPTLESDTQKQIQSLVLNVEQRNAINDKALKKIITGGYGSGKSIVGKEIVKNCITHKSQNPLTLFYICCNHFSLYECHMKEFVDSIDKSSNVSVVCDSLYELWKIMCKNKNTLNNCISLPKLLEYLASTNRNKVCFVLEELSEEYVKEEDATQIKHLLASKLKDSLVVFIPESITKNRELVTNKQKRTLQRNYFQEEIIGMKVISLNKSMRVTECNKLLIDIAQKVICETKSVLNIPNLNFKILEENKKKSLFGVEDSQIEERKDFQSLMLTFDSRNDSKNETPNSIENYVKDKEKINDASHYDLNDTIKVNKDNQYASVMIKKDNSFSSNITNNKTVNKFKDSIDSKITNKTVEITNKTVEITNKAVEIINKTVDNKTVDNFTDCKSDQSSARIENKFNGSIVNGFHDNDLDYMAKLITKSINNIDPNGHMETEYVFKPGNIGHSIKGEKPKVVYLPFHDITDKQSVKLLSIVLEKICFNVLRKTVVICNNIEEVQSVAYAIDTIKYFKAVTYSPHLQNYSPTLEAKFKIHKNLRSELDILVTDCKGFSGAESESVIVFVSPEEIYLRHVLVDAISRSNSFLTVFVKSCSGIKELLNSDKTIGNVLEFWSEEVVEKITVATSSTVNQKTKDGFFIVDENCKEFIDRGSTNDFAKYKKSLQFQIFHENNFIYETMASNLSYQNDLSRLSAELKKFYLENYGKIGELQPLLRISANFSIHKYFDPITHRSILINENFDVSVEQNKLFNNQMGYTPITYSEIFTKEKSVIIISGIAGIGKTWLLKKCLLDWSNSLIWKNVEFVFYLECRRLNQYPNISNINELLNVLYKDIMNGLNINSHTAMFIIDGLDEFKYVNELLNPSLTLYPIVNALAEITKYKHVVAGRVYAIDHYQSLSTKHSDKLIILIMGFNENKINNYIENHVVEEKKEVVKTTLKESPIAKAMASVPFYLSLMCKIISDSKKIGSNSFLTMTDLYVNIFFYCMQNYIKNNKLLYEVMEDSSNKKYILNICKIAYKVLVENKIFLSKEEVQAFYSDFDKNEGNFFGFIEKIKTDLGCYYQFAHLTIVEFCASVYAYNCLSFDEIMGNKKLKSCLSMVCGLANKNQNSLLKFLAYLNPSKKSSKESSLLCSILDRLIKSKDRKDFHDLFYECFYESQSSFTDEIKSIVDQKRKWIISIDDGKTSYLTSCENYFVNHYLKSGRKLWLLRVDKNILSDEEKKLLIQCSTNVRYVSFHRPINFEGWKPKDKIETLWISISRYLITKIDFKENFLPWINLCEELYLLLHKDIDFFEEICEWIRCSNIKEFEISYRGKYFCNLHELKNFTTR